MAKRILVPLESSARGEAVLPLVADLARAAGATVRLLHVIPYLPTRISDDARVAVYAHQHEEWRTAQALAWLRALEPLLEGVAVEPRVRVGDPSVEIVREAEVFGADAVVVQASRPRWWRRALGRIVADVRAASPARVLILSEVA